MFYIYEGFSYENVDYSTFTKQQEALVKFIKTFDEEMAVKREENEAKKEEVDGEDGFDMKFFGLSASDVPSSAKYGYLLVFGAAVVGAIWYLISKLDDGKGKKSDKKRKSPAKSSPSPKASKAAKK